MKSQKQLLEQYYDEVQTRIADLTDQRDADEAAEDDLDVAADIVDDYDQQIAHWSATLAEIKEALRRMPS